MSDKEETMDSIDGMLIKDAGQRAYNAWVWARVDGDPASNDAAVWDEVAHAVLSGITPTDLLAVVRRGVESGTIKLDYEAAAKTWMEEWGTEYENEDVELVKRIVDAALGVIPVSDGGSET